jgi:hypothetical protein
MLPFKSLVAIGACAATLAGCTSTDLQNKQTSSAEAAADLYCQQEQGLAFGTAAYQSCITARLDFIASSAARATVR